MNTDNPTLSLMFSRALSGFGAGIAGSVILGIILFLSWSIIGETLIGTTSEQTEFGAALDNKEAHPLFLVMVTMAVFLATLVANLVYPLILSITEEKYHHKYTTLTHTFFGNLIVLVLMLPIYLAANSTIGQTGIAGAALLHIILSGFVGFMILEIIHNGRHLLIRVYGFALTIVIFSVEALIFSSSNPTLLSFLILPLFLATLGLCTGFSEVFYQWLKEKYSTDFLDSHKLLGTDYGQKTETKPDFDI